MDDNGNGLCDCTLLWEDVAQPPRRDGLVALLRAQRHYRATEMIARQLALAEGVPLTRHRKRLMAEAARVIAARPGLARWRA
jgi:hypothetical protein